MKMRTIVVPSRLRAVMARSYCLCCALKLRAVPININFRFVAKEIAYMIDNADLVGVVSEVDLAGPLDEAVGDASLPVWRIPDQWEEVLAGGSGVRDFGPRSPGHSSRRPSWTRLLAADRAFIGIAGPSLALAALQEERAREDGCSA